MLKSKIKYILISEAPVLHNTQIYCLPALICIYSSCFVSAAPGSPANQKEVLLSGLEREIICVSLKRDPKNGFGKKGTFMLCLLLGLSDPGANADAC